MLEPCQLIQRAMTPTPWLSWPLWALHAPWMTELPQESSRANLLTLRCQLQGVLKGSGAQAMLSSILPVAGNDKRRNKKRQQINTWLSAWCHWQNLGRFFDCGSVYRAPGLLNQMGYMCLKAAVQCLRPRVLQPHFTMLRCVEQGPPIPLDLEVLQWARWTGGLWQAYFFLTYNILHTDKPWSHQIMEPGKRQVSS